MDSEQAEQETVVVPRALWERIASFIRTDVAYDWPDNWDAYDRMEWLTGLQESAESISRELDAYEQEQGEG